MLGAWVSFLAFPILITFSHPINCFAAGLILVSKEAYVPKYSLWAD
jgi:hypothetical protein